MSNSAAKKSEYIDINQIYEGDSLELLDYIEENSVHLVFTSPPYNAGHDYDNYDDSLEWNKYRNFLTESLSKVHKLLVKGGRLAINVPFAIKHRKTKDVKFLATLIAGICEEIGFKQFEFITWHKGINIDHFQGNNTAWGSWKSPSHPVFRGLGEVVMVFSKGQSRLPGDKNKADITSEEFKEWTKNLWYLEEEEAENNLWHLEGDKAYKNLVCIPNYQKKAKHPCPFPDELAKRIIKLYSYQENLILDPFNGIGTTTKIAHELNRDFIGIDQSKIYCEIARSKIMKGKKNDK